MSSTPSTTKPSSTVEDGVTGKQVVLILVGLVGSGKSTFAQALEEHFPEFRRCNQDELGNRHRVEALARQSLSEGKSVCVDRTNVDESQRSHWIRIAREFPHTSIWVIVFDTPYDVCATRLRERFSHPTIKSPEQGLYVLSRFAADLKLPATHEGYDHIIFLKPSDHTSKFYSRSDITAILQRLRTSPLVTRAHARGSFLARRMRAQPYGNMPTRATRFRARGYSLPSRGTGAREPDITARFAPVQWRNSQRQPENTAQSITATSNTTSTRQGSGTSQDPFIIK